MILAKNYIRINEYRASQEAHLFLWLEQRGLALLGSIV